MSPLSLLPAAAVIGLLALTACDEQRAPAGQILLTEGSRYQVARIDGAEAPQGVTLEIPEAGRIAGQAPCNRYFASLTQDGGTLAVGPAGATRMACLDGDRSAAETAFFAALESVRTVDAGPEDGQIALGDGSRTRLVLIPAD